MKDKLSIQCSTEKEEKKEILETYKINSINVSGRVLNLIREDISKLKEIDGNEK